MRHQQRSRIRRTNVQVLLVPALLAALVPRLVLAQDALTPHVDPADNAPLVQQTGTTAPGPSGGQLIPAAQFVEDPTRQAGGEDDAQRADERQNERQTDQQDDDGDRRRR